jgi:hypothetical protein
MMMIPSVFTKFNFKIPLCPSLSKWDLGGFTSRLVMLFLILIWCGVSSAEVALDSFLPKELPDGWVLIEGPRLFNRKTLFEHIDGQAELYFKYGYRRSLFATYHHPKRPEEQIEIDIYDMGNVLQAFGIFSRFRTEDRPGGIGLDSYLDDRSLLFYKGRYYVMLYATEPDPSNLRELALAVSSRISDSTPRPEEINFFPVTGLKPGSIQYFSEGLLGHKFLKRGFQGIYLDQAEDKTEAEDNPKVEVKAKVEADPKESRLFLAIFKNADEAKNAIKVFKDYLSKKGNVHPKISAGFGPNALEGEDPYHGKILMVQKGYYLIGTTGFQKEEKAETRLVEMVRNVK